MFTPLFANFYSVLADMVAGIHLAFVAFIVFGQVAIVIAAFMKWEWGRNPWFRYLHLTAIAYVVYEALLNIRCPLTVWEEDLRRLSGQNVVEESFIGWLFHKILFIEVMPSSFFTTIYIATLIIVLQGLLMYPPRRIRFFPSLFKKSPSGST